MKSLLLGVFIGAASLGASGFGAVIVTSFPEPREVFSDFTSIFEHVDIDGNGSVDFAFTTYVGGTSLRTELSNRAIIRLAGGRSIAGPVTPVPLEYAIGPTLGPGETWPLLWASSDFLGGYVSPGEWSFKDIVVSLSTGSSTDFRGRAPVGIEFAAADGLHYGFLDITAGPGYSGITFHGFAYETQPGVPIAAGAVPEPSTALLLGIGLLVPLARRRREPIPAA